MTNEKLDELERLYAAAQFTEKLCVSYDELGSDDNLRLCAFLMEGDPDDGVYVAVDEDPWTNSDPPSPRLEAIAAAINALPELVARVRELEGALSEMTDCQPLPKIYKYTGTAEVDVENMFDVGHRHANGRKPYDYLKSWLSMLRPFAYATQDDSWGEMEKLLSIVMNNYVQTLVKAEAARAALQTKGQTT